MILGLSLPELTVVHVVISLVAITSGAFVLTDMIDNRPLGLWNILFLASTIMTSVTGFLFPLSGLDLAVMIGAVSLAALGVALFALFGRHLQRGWGLVYVASAVTALYLNIFLFLAQAFEKVPFLHALAAAPVRVPYLVAQALVLAALAALGYRASRRFQPSQRSAENPVTPPATGWPAARR